MLRESLRNYQVIATIRQEPCDENYSLNNKLNLEFIILNLNSPHWSLPPGINMLNFQEAWRELTDSLKVQEFKL